MFEQSTLSNSPAGVRAWTTFFGLTTQVALVSLAMLVPMVCYIFITYYAFYGSRVRVQALAGVGA